MYGTIGVWVNIGPSFSNLGLRLQLLIQVIVQSRQKIVFINLEDGAWRRGPDTRQPTTPCTDVRTLPSILERTQSIMHERRHGQETEETPMTIHVLCVQGGGTGTDDDWDSKLVESLERELSPEYELGYPRMPLKADPKYVDWKVALDWQFARLDDGAILSGTSSRSPVLATSYLYRFADSTSAAVFAGGMSHSKPLSRPPNGEGAHL